MTRILLVGSPELDSEEVRAIEQLLVRAGDHCMVGAGKSFREQIKLLLTAEMVCLMPAFWTDRNATYIQIAAGMLHLPMTDPAELRELKSKP